jgi:hypothetical protein
MILRRTTTTMGALLALAVPASALADHKPDHQTPPVQTPALPTGGCGKEPAKISMERATVQREGSLLDVLAPITGRASGNVNVALSAAGERTTFSVPIDEAKDHVRFTRPIPAKQARLGTGILTLTYPGDADTRPQEVRLRAASGQANLEMQRPRIDGDRIKAQGRVTDKARGVVRVQLQWLDQACNAQTIERLARIQDDGSWKLDEPLTPEQKQGIETRRGSLHSYTLFTGYFAERIRGEMESYEVLGERK